MGKCKAALDLLSREKKGGILHLGDLANPNPSTVREVLISEHPEGQPARNIPDEPQTPHPMIFESRNANAICFAALRVNGAADPTGLDSHEWKLLCTSHKSASRDLDLHLPHLSGHKDQYLICALLTYSPTPRMSSHHACSTNVLESAQLASETWPAVSLPKLSFPSHSQTSRMHQAATRCVEDRFLGLRLPFMQYAKLLTQRNVKLPYL